MARPSRARCILKWTGVGLSLTIVGTWLSTARYMGMAGWYSASIQVFNGVLVLELVKTFDIRYRPDQFRLSFGKNDFHSLSPSWPHVSRSDHNNSPFRPSFTISRVSLPFWLLLLLTAIPTAWLWHRDRQRIRLGCCLRCGYDLKGNTSGVCPECGDKVHPPAVLADSECGEPKPPPATV